MLQLLVEKEVWETQDLKVLQIELQENLLKALSEKNLQYGFNYKQLLISVFFDYIMQ